MGSGVHAAWMPLWMQLSEAVQPSPAMMYFASKLQSLKNDILIF